MAQRRRFTLAVAVAAGSGLSAPALADCGSDMQKLAQQRNVELQKINDFAKSFHGKPLDPEVLREVGRPIHAETALIAYMEKNKDWCSFPDDAINGLKTSHAKNPGFSAKACTVAEKIKKMKEQAAQGGGGGPQAQPFRPGRFDGRAERLGGPAGRAAGEPRPEPHAGFRASLRPARPARPAGRLAIAAGALLAVDGAGGARAPSRAQSLASRALPRRRDRDARRGLDL